MVDVVLEQDIRPLEFEPREVRARLGLSRDKVAKLASCSIPTLRTYELSRAAVTLPARLKLDDAFRKLAELESAVVR